MVREPRDGALGYKDANGEFQWANPRDALFSTVTMIATHMWNDGEWTPIYADESESDDD